MNKLKECSLLLGMGQFEDSGGWVLDTQFISTMGAPYLLAHGLGTPVRDAVQRVAFPGPGTYRTFVYTCNWVAPWKPEYAPGMFEVSVNGVCLGTFGDQGTGWLWQEGESVKIEREENTVALHDLTGFEGRCGMLFFTRDRQAMPPVGRKELREFFDGMTGNDAPALTRRYDMVVAGGGIAGICCALSCARRGLETALIQDRNVVGGNNSSEVRVWLGGKTNFEPFPGVGNIVHELEQARKGHYGCENTADLYEDDKKLALLEAQENLTLYLGHVLTDVEMDSSRIAAVVALDVRRCTYVRLQSRLFADCTGDATLGFLAGADHEVTTNGHMGMTNAWHIKDTGVEQTFPRCPWAIDLSAADFPGRSEVRDIYGTQGEKSLGCWFWESGCELDPIEKAEYARDTNFRAMYGAWDCLKNIDHSYKTYRLEFCGYIGGKRESRRMFGDVMLTKSDVFSERRFEDGCVPTTWNFDVHYPDKRFYAAYAEGDAFLTHDYHEDFKTPYFIPYRCLYSRNVSNLYFAGRDISVSHDALGTARIMRTGGMMGEVIGYAAKLCLAYDCSPREIYERHLEEFLQQLKSIPCLVSDREKVEF